MTDHRTTYDVVVIGAGHNGLAAAALLAKQGRKVLVLEERGVAGGLAVGDEFHSGYTSAGLLHDTSGVRPSVVEALQLGKHGLEFHDTNPPVLALNDEGPGFLLHGDPTAAAREIHAFSATDASRFGEFAAYIDRVSPVVRRVLDDIPPDLSDSSLSAQWRLLSKGMALRKLGRRDMMDLLRIGPMCVADWLDEWFKSEPLKCAMAAPSLWGNYLGPWSPGSAGTLLRREVLAGRMVKGGAASLITALAGAAGSNGVEVRTSASVERIRVSGGKVAGVILASGEPINARFVAASCDPKRALLKLLAPTDLSPTVVGQTAGYRTDGVTAKVNLALNCPLKFKGREDSVIEYARTGAKWDDIERSFDAIKYGQCSVEPVLDVFVPSASKPSLAPPGHSVVSMVLHYAPYDLRGGWTDEDRERLGDAAVSVLGRHVKKLDEAIVAREVLSPVDIEKKYGVTGGHLYHGHHGLDQLLSRPSPHCARYATPVEGLFLCGSGSHPGGGLTCGPGALAARTILSTA